MTTIRLYANASAALKYDYPNQNFHSEAVETLGKNDLLLTGFEDLAAEHRYHKITDAELYVYTGGAYDYPEAAFLAASFNEATATYNNHPGMAGDRIWNMTDGSSWHHADVTFLAPLFHNGVAFWHNLYRGVQFYTSRSTYKPYIELLLDEDTSATVAVGKMQPSSGYVPRSAANTFKWSVYTPTNCYGGIEQTAAVFAWRPKGGGTEQTISLTTEQTVTIPANTFPAGGIEWQVRATANTGDTATSAWLTVETDEPLPFTTPTEPVDLLVDGTATTVFRWSYAISTGTAQSAADVQTSADGETWATLGIVSGSDTFYEAAAGTLAAGTLFWRVRAYNSEGAAGSWSTAAQIVVVAGPAAPSVSATAVPFSTVSWQATGQQAWELAVDGKTIDGAWGGAKSAKLTDPLTDGTHVIGVRVQNVYGFWSDWSEISVAIANAPGGNIILSRTEGGHYVALTVSASGYERFRILRDEEPIGEIAQTTFSDDTAPVGAHRYQIMGILANGNYGMSNAVNATIVIKAVMLKDLTTGTWLELPTARDGQTAISASYTMDVSAAYYSGRNLPTAEIGARAGRVLTVRPAFAISEAPRLAALEALLRRQLFYKDPQGRAFPAVIYALTSENDRGRIACNMTILETDGGDGDA